MSTTTIKINSNGSIRIEGDDFKIIDANGTTYDLGGRTSVALCRCGLSMKKPFCDGAHKGQFEDEAVAYDLPPVAPKQ